MTTPLSGGDTVPASPPPAEPDPTALDQRKPRRPALVVLALVALSVLGIDVLTKQLALTHLSDGSVVRLLGGAVYFDLTRNSGAAFSIGSDYTVVFPIVGLVVVAGIVWLARDLRSSMWALAIGLILGGVMGNLSDRLFRAPSPFHGHVVDFISVFAKGGEKFPIFNTADSALFCGVTLAILLEFTGRRRDGTRIASGGRDGDGASAGDGAGDSGRDKGRGGAQGSTVRDSDHEGA